MSMPVQRIQQQIDAQSQAAVNSAMTVTFFSYSIQFLNVAAAAGVFGGNLQITADADFMIQYVNAMTIDRTTHAQLASVATVQITDQGAGFNLFNIAVPLDSISGNGQRPFLMPIQYLVTANSTLNFAGTNGTTTNAIDIYLTLIGYKVYH